MINDQINLLFLITVPIYAHTLRLNFFVCFVQPKIPILFGHVKKDIKQFCLYFDKKNGAVTPVKIIFYKIIILLCLDMQLKG